MTGIQQRMVRGAALRFAELASSPTSTTKLSPQMPYHSDLSRTSMFVVLGYWACKWGITIAQQHSILPNMVLGYWGLLVTCCLMFRRQPSASAQITHILAHGLLIV